jgi:hypothetical protein
VGPRSTPSPSAHGDFRSSKLSKPVTGDLVWSIPTLGRLNPIGAPLAHVGLHVSARVHNYNSNLFPDSEPLGEIRI